MNMGSGKSDGSMVGSTSARRRWVPAKRSRILVVSALLVPLAWPATPVAAASQRVYRGTATVTLWHYDECNNSGRIVDSGSFRFAAQFRRKDGPLVAGGRRELNPFNWVMAVGSSGQTGATEFWSAVVTRASGKDLNGNVRDPRLLMGYWKTGIQSDGSFSGRLVNDHAAESHAINLVNAPKQLNPCNPSWGGYPYTFAARVGATIQGTVTSGRANLQVDGAAGSAYRFRVTFSGS